VQQMQYMTSHVNIVVVVVVVIHVDSEGSSKQGDVCFQLWSNVIHADVIFTFAP